MWDQAAKPLANLLGTKLYPALYSNPHYRAFLKHCGILPPFPKDPSRLDTHQRLNLAGPASLHARLFSMELQGLKAMQHATAQAIELKGPLTLHRLYKARNNGGEVRFFWFTDALLQESRRRGSHNHTTQTQWLQRQLAFPYDWSHCDRITTLQLQRGELLPAARADGLPAPHLRQAGGLANMNIFAAKQFDEANFLPPGTRTQYLLYLLPHGRVQHVT